MSEELRVIFYFKVVEGLEEYPVLRRSGPCPPFARSAILVPRHWRQTAWYGMLGFVGGGILGAIYGDNVVRPLPNFGSA